MEFSICRTFGEIFQIGCFASRLETQMLVPLWHNGQLKVSSHAGASGFETPDAELKRGFNAENFTSADERNQAANRNDNEDENWHR